MMSELPDDLPLSPEATAEIQEQLTKPLKFLLAFDSDGTVKSFTPPQGQGINTNFPVVDGYVLGAPPISITYYTATDGSTEIVICRWIDGEYTCKTY